MLTDLEREVAQQIFRAHGYDRPLRIAPPTGEDEWIFLVPSWALTVLPERTLVSELQEALHRKIAIAAEGHPWPESEPLR